MKKIISSMIVLCSLWLAATPAVAQQTTGTVTGRILDDQGAAVPGATVTAKNPTYMVKDESGRTVLVNDPDSVKKK
jgi:hypothetical protein